MKKLSAFAVTDPALICDSENTSSLYEKSSEMYYNVLDSLKKEIQYGWDSVTNKSGWVSEEEAYRILEINQ